MILLLVKNNITASQIEVYMEGAEYQTLKLKRGNTDLHLINYYFSSDRPQALETLPLKGKMIVCGDFNSGTLHELLGNNLVAVTIGQSF